MPRRKKVLPEDVEQCGNCHFFAPEDDNTGWCRRNPPTIIFDPEDRDLGSTHPPVKTLWWCGEYKRKLQS